MSDTVETRRGRLGVERLPNGRFVVAVAGGGRAELDEAELRWLAAVGAPAVLPPVPTAAEVLAARSGRGPAL